MREHPLLLGYGTMILQKYRGLWDNPLSKTKIARVA
jgi:hypothetical protein